MTGTATAIRRAAESLSGRLTSAFEWRLYRPLHLKYAAYRRARLDRVTFVGITGSAGKTSAKSMITEILKAAGSVRQTSGTGNRLFHIAEVISETRPTENFCVLELSAERPGYFDRLMALVRPDIGVITTVGDDQLKSFGSREAIAAEKGKLIAGLPPGGTAVLNADDPLVRAMGARFKGRTITFGEAEDADLQVRDIRSSWPERLSFTVRFAGRDHQVRTQLCGRHWTSSVLAALATGVAAGLALEKAAEVVTQVLPNRARMEPVPTPEGITFIRDDWKGAYWGMPTVYDFLREARAERKVLVVGTLADYHGTVRSRYRIVGEEALKVADAVIFVGPMATYGLRAQRFAAAGQTVLAYPDTRQAAVALQDFLRAGDLVVLKGAARADHLGRLLHARTGPVACWRMDCGKDMLCDACPKLRGGETAAPLPPVREPAPVAQAALAGAPADAPAQVIVGIGNPGEKFRDTPHNVGFAVLDRVAERNGLTWEDHEEAQVARLPGQGGRVLLVKTSKQVNNTGKSLLCLAREMGFCAADCVLVQDDIHLPAGKVRFRMKGGDGGHLGVRSTLIAFQTSDIRRIKVGVAASAEQIPTLEYLLSPLPPEVLPKVLEGCGMAAERVEQLAKEAAASA